MPSNKFYLKNLFILLFIIPQCVACSFSPAAKQPSGDTVKTQADLSMGDRTSNPIAILETIPSTQTDISSGLFPEPGAINSSGYLIVPNIPAPEQPSLGGGIIQDGPFVFDLHLYREPLFSADPIAPSLYSDIEGIGVYAVWKYQGPDVADPVAIYWGNEPNLSVLLSQEKYLQAGIKQGDGDGRNGGLILPEGSRVGDVIRVVLKVDTAHDTYGAVLIFILGENDEHELVPVDITVQALHAG